MFENECATGNGKTLALQIQFFSSLWKVFFRAFANFPHADAAIRPHATARWMCADCRPRGHADSGPCKGSRAETLFVLAIPQ